MKKIVIVPMVLFLLMVPAVLLAQRVEAIEVKGTEYVVVPYDDVSKNTDIENGIKFINTRTGQIKKEKLPVLTYVHRLDQINLELLQLNKIVVLARTEGAMKGRVLIQSHLYVYSTSGVLEKSTTFSHPVDRNYVVNTTTGAIVFTYASGDMKDSGKIQKEIIYDLKTNSIIAE